MVAAFSLTLLLGVDMGVLAAIAVHVLLLVIATIKMRVEELVDSGDGLFVHVLDDPFSQPVPGIVLAKVTDSLVYLNIESFMKQVELLLKAHGSLLPEKHAKIIPRTPSTASPQQSLNASTHGSDLDVSFDNGPDADIAIEPALESGYRSQGFERNEEVDDFGTNGDGPHHPLAAPTEDDDDALDTNGLDVALDAAEDAPLRSTTTSFASRKRPSINRQVTPEEANDPARKHPNAVVFDFSMVNAVDSSAMFRLEELRKILATEGYSMHFAHVHSAVLEVMYRGDFLNELGPNGLFISLREAADYLLSVKDKQMVTIP